MEWTDMRESFYAVLLLKPAIHPEKPQESSASGTSTVSAGRVTFLDRQDARVRLRLDSSARGKLASPCYVRVYEGWVHQRGFAAQGNGFGVPYFVIPFSWAQAIN